MRENYFFLERNSYKKWKIIRCNLSIYNNYNALTHKDLIYSKFNLYISVGTYQQNIWVNCD